ncbi:hypothetical protein C2S52_005158 [Perilla frutescens var. hirtella]|nr:hypothetical protein C2S52_005158 [Perilla frutescens var. hirtella]
MSLLASIREKLGKDNMQDLRSSCFGHLFRIPDLQFQGQLFNVLLRKLDKGSVSHNCLAFDINGCRLEFTPADFAIVIGLKFNGWFDPPLESKVHRTVFRQRTSVTLDDIVQAFNSECRTSFGNSTLSLRLTYLVILFGILLVTGGKSKSIDMTYLHLIDDLERFKSFPWGHVAYSHLVLRTHQSRRVVDNIERLNKRLAFDTNDFVLVLQVWVYEVIPIVSRNCTVRLGRGHQRIPRMLRWTASMSIRFDLVNQYFLQAPSDSLLRSLTVSAAENQFLQKLGIDTAVVCPAGPKHGGIEYDSPVGTKEASADSPHQTTSPAPVMSAFQISDDVYVFKFGREFTTACTSIKSVMERVETHSDDHLRGVVPKPCIGGHSLRPSSENDPIAEADENACLAQPSLSKAPVNLADVRKEKMLESPTTFLPFSHASKKRKAKVTRRRRRPATRSTIDLSTSSKGRLTAPNAVHPRQYDPTDAGYDRTLVKEFESWLSKSITTVRQGVLILPFAMVCEADAGWFEPLWQRREWLTTDHMNALIDMLLIASRREPGRFLDGWTALEMICWDALTNENYEIVRDRLSQYVLGGFPRDGPLHWFLPARYMGLDTFMEITGELPPQQTNDHDCGIMAMKYMEFLVSGHDVKVINLDRCGVFRRAYCAKIWSLGEELLP